MAPCKPGTPQGMQGKHGVGRPVIRSGYRAPAGETRPAKWLCGRGLARGRVRAADTPCPSVSSADGRSLGAPGAGRGPCPEAWGGCPPVVRAARGGAFHNRGGRDAREATPVRARRSWRGPPSSDHRPGGVRGAIGIENPDPGRMPMRPGPRAVPRASRAGGRSRGRRRRSRRRPRRS